MYADGRPVYIGVRLECVCEGQAVGVLQLLEHLLTLLVHHIFVVWVAVRDHGDCLLDRGPVVISVIIRISLSSA